MLHQAKHTVDSKQSLFSLPPTSPPSFYSPDSDGAQKSHLIPPADVETNNSLMFGPLALALLLAITHPATAFAMEAPPAKKLKASDYLSSIPEGPPDAILGIAEAFKACTDEKKVNVCVGAYRDSNGKPWILPSVRKAVSFVEEYGYSCALFETEICSYLVS